MSGPIDVLCDAFDEAIKKCERPETEDHHKFDFDLFREEIEKNGNVEVIKLMAELLLRSASNLDQDEDFLYTVYEIARGINGFQEEGCFLLHYDPNGVTIKGRLPEGMKLTIEGEEQ